MLLRSGGILMWQLYNTVITQAASTPANHHSSILSIWKLIYIILVQTYGLELQTPTCINTIHMPNIASQGYSFVFKWSIEAW